MKIDLVKQPCMVRKLATGIALASKLASAENVVILLTQPPTWTVVALTTSVDTSPRIFPDIHWHELTYLNEHELNQMAPHAAVVTRKAPDDEAGYVSYVSLVDEQKLYGVLCLTHRSPLCPQTQELLDLQAQQIAQTLFQSKIYHELLEQLSSEQSIAAATDVSARSLSTWQNRYEAAGWASGQILYEWNFVQNRPIWGPNTDQILGYLPDEMPNSFEQWSALIHPDEQELFRTSVNQAIKTRQPLRVEYRIRHADGEYRWVEDRNHVFIDSVTYSLCVVGFIIDIHSRKLDEERFQNTHLQLQQAFSQLEQATQFKDEFLACMSHELRTPLNSILGMTEMLLERLYGSLTDQQVRCLDKVVASSEHLLLLINDVLDVAKIEAGTLEIDCQPTDLRKLCQASMDYIHAAAQKKSMQVQLHLPDGMPNACIDQRRIRQVLINLLNNAVKFTADGGQIDLSLEIHAQIQGIEFAVRDTGIGICPDALARLFEPFSQVHTDLAREHDGAGLGLGLSQRIVARHGGEILVESEYGVGSCFRVVLPNSFVADGVNEAMTASTDFAAISPAVANSATLLLAEDNLANIEIFSDYLENFGYQVVVAKDGLQALDVAQTCGPDLMLVDIQLPKRDGFEVMRLVREHPSLQNCPIIALTALAMAGDEQRCLQAGADAYLSKPVKLKLLLQTIQNLLARHGT